MSEGVERYTVKQDRSLLRAHNIETAIFVLPFGVGCFCLLFSASTQSESGQTTCCQHAEPAAFWYWLFPLLTVNFAIGCWRDISRFRRFACPTCRAMLDVNPAGPGQPITFTCDACETIWDTGFKEPADFS